MTLPPFDGSDYRKTVLSQLREGSPAEVEDLFWIGCVPREVDDPAQIAARLIQTKGFLNKERSRARQAAVALAVLREWPRIEAGLTDADTRRALRERLATTPTLAPTAASRRRVSGRVSDGAARRRRQIAAGLGELARLRGEPELASDLFAFLGLPTTATGPIIAERMRLVGEVNRRRRADRERALVDELLAAAREQLIANTPAAYFASFALDAREAVVDSLLAGDISGAASALAHAREQDVEESAILEVLTPHASVAVAAIPLSSLGIGVWCPICGAVDVYGAQHCTSCRGALTVKCDTCRTSSIADVVSCASCGASLEPSRAPLVARRKDVRAEQAALGQLDSLSEPERQIRLATLAAEHPSWNQVRQRLAAVPPTPVARLVVAIRDGEAHLSWPTSQEQGVDAYLVERVEPEGSRVLGRTSVNSWVDSLPPREATSWRVRALRGESASQATAAVRPAAAPAPVRDASAIAGVPVLLQWTAPPGAEIVLIRVDGQVRRRLTADPSGYRDRHVSPGRQYQYQVSVAGQSEPPLVLSVTPGSGASVLPSGALGGQRPAAAPDPAAPSGQRHAAPATSSPAAIPPVSCVRAAREPDGRLRVTWVWPPGVTEAFLIVGARPARRASGAGQKVTNARYELDGGAARVDAPPGSHITVFAGRRNGTGEVQWGPVGAESRAVAP